MGYEEQYKQYVSDIETALQGALPLRKITERCIYESARYSLLAGGKRVRPVLLLEFATRFGCDKERAMPYALALEMIHTYSLIHEDLPCMDNDSMRRGRPTNHMLYGEAVALLAGDALLNRAYELMLNAAIKDGLNGVKAAAYISRSAGIAGMIGGQGIDLVSENQPVDAFVLTDMYLKKTCALIDAACVGGALLGGASRDVLNTVSEYADQLGLAFQVVDDILDVEGNEAELGKDIGSDAGNGKSTSVSVFGMEEAKERAKAYSLRAEGRLHSLPSSGFLLWFTRKLLQRRF